jgi:hypothetical protein
MINKIQMKILQQDWCKPYSFYGFHSYALK